MSQTPEDFDWSLTTWEGARRAQLRHALRLTLRERLQVLDDMNEVAEHFRHMRETGKFSTARPAPARTPASEAPAAHQPEARYGTSEEADSDDGGA